MKYIFSVFIFTVLLFLPMCRNHNRESIIRNHELFVEKSWASLPYIQSLKKNERVIPVMEGFPKLNDGSDYRFYFLKDGRYVCTLSFSVSFDDAFISGYRKVTFQVMELKEVSLTESGSVRRSYGRNWKFDDETDLNKLHDAHWDLSVLGIEDGPPIENNHLVYDSWMFLYR